MHRLLLAVAALTVPGPARAEGFVKLQSADDARLSVHRAVLHALPDQTWALELEVKGEGTVTLPEVKASLPAPAVLDAALHHTAPRFLPLEAWDPCHFDPSAYARLTPPSAEHPWPHGPRAWPTEWPRAQRERLEPSGERVWSVATEHPRWLPPIAVRLDEQDGTLRWPLEALDPFAPPGRPMRIDLVSLRPGMPVGPETSVDLPSKLGLPEVSYEYPRDTADAIQRHVQRSHGSPVRLFGAAWRAPKLGEVYAVRYGLERLPGDPPLSLVPAPLTEPLEPIWYIHRPWRGPMACGIRVDYQFAVAKQQVMEHQLYATATGRRLQLIVDLSKERGYLLLPFANPEQAAYTEEGLPPVEVDRSRW